MAAKKLTREQFDYATQKALETILGNMEHYVESAADTMQHVIVVHVEDDTLRFSPTTRRLILEDLEAVGSQLTTAIARNIRSRPPPEEIPVVSIRDEDGATRFMQVSSIHLAPQRTTGRGGDA